jgi:hypothetical protein
LAPKQVERGDVLIPDNGLPEYETRKNVEEFNKNAGFPFAG